MKKCFFYSDPAVTLHAHCILSASLIIWTMTVKVLNEAQTKPLGANLKYLMSHIA